VKGNIDTSTGTGTIKTKTLLVTEDLNIEGDLKLNGVVFDPTNIVRENDYVTTTNFLTDYIINDKYTKTNSLLGGIENATKTKSWHYFRNSEIVSSSSIAQTLGFSQENNGRTFVNAAPGQEIHLRINNETKLKVHQNGGIEIYEELIVDGNLTTTHSNTNKLYVGPKSHIANDQDEPNRAALTVAGRTYITDDVETQFSHTVLKTPESGDENFENFLLWVDEGIVSVDFAIASIDDWPDYVFNADYKLPSLEEVEKNIKDNGHLHTMPSGNEIEKNGFTLSDITKRTVKTIEELTLHTIAQNKKLKKQEALILELIQRLEKLEQDLKE
jgi:hypothetical protein